MFKVIRKTKRTFIQNRWAFGGGWYENVTFIYLTLFGVKVKTLHSYFISYRGELSFL